MPVQLKRSSVLSAINLTPIIDMVFLLLIFFLVAARVADEEAKLELDLPDVSEALPASFQPNELIISVDADGKYFIEGAFRQTEQVEQLMRRSFANNPLTQAVIIRADRRTDWEHVALLLDLCKKIGFHQYSATFDDE